MEHADTLNVRSRRRKAAPPRGLLRNATVAFASVGVIALLVAYALAAPTPELRLEIGHVVPQPGATAVVEGRVIEPDASGLGGSRVEVRRGSGLSGIAVTDGAGRFRVDLAGACGTYEVVLQASWKGSALEERARRRLCPGDSLPVEARVVTQGHYLWVPGPR